MQAKRIPQMSPRRRGVNTARRTVGAVLVTLISAMAPHAFAGEKLVDRVVTVRLDAAAMKTEAGSRAAYAKLQKHALRSCRSDRGALRALGVTARDCADDLVAQFVASADHPGLTQVHVTAVQYAAAESRPAAG